MAADKSYGLHYFGGGILWMAFVQSLADAGSEGLLEFDCHRGA